MWYINLSLPQDNLHHILDNTVNGELNSIPQQLPHTDNIPTTCNTLVPNASSSIPMSSTYVTREEMEQLMNTHMQHILSDVSELCNNLKTTIVADVSGL